ncbi:hypothetical protein CIK06_25465 [Plantactinospora sp. KBS50]|nr:hypothetical protein CIK06_25465 [Plantactinospora sp. KBS50]
MRQQARKLVNDLPGPLRRVRVRAGAAVIEVEWQEPRAGGYPGRVEETVLLPVPNGSAEPPAVAGTVLGSPMVGTFYRAAAPTDAPFIEVGDPVEEGQTVGIVEAMKLFNPIVAECAGTVAEILVGNGEPVQFGQPILRLASGDGAPAADPER